MSNQHAIMIILLVAVVLLVIGSGIYFYCRLPIIAFDKLHIVSGKIIIGNTKNPFVYFIVFCLPDALWYMALLLLQTWFLKEKGWLNRLLVGIAVSLPFLLEVGQYLGFISGTFDWFDILTYCLTLILFLCLRKLFLSLHYKS